MVTVFVLKVKAKTKVGFGLNSTITITISFTTGKSCIIGTYSQIAIYKIMHGCFVTKIVFLQLMKPHSLVAT